MHIKTDPQTFTVTLTRKEIDLIAYGLVLHAANPGTVVSKAAQCTKLAASFQNALTLNPNKIKPVPATTN